MRVTNFSNLAFKHLRELLSACIVVIHYLFHGDFRKKDLNIKEPQ